MTQASALWLVARHRHATSREIRAFQTARLRQLVAHAHEHVPYYRALFDRHGVKPDHVRTLADLPLLPTTSKSELQMLPAHQLVARGVDLDRLLVKRSSGSSGQPFSTRRTWFEERVLVALRLRVMRDLGLRMADRHAVITLLQGEDPRDSQVLQRLIRRCGLYRKLQIDCRQAPDEIIRILEGFRPDVISGYPGVLSRVAQGVTRGGRGLVRPHLVVTGGEVLTPLMRRQIGDAFPGPVLQLYGCHEFKTIAWQCPRTGNLHVADDSVVVEVLRDGRPVEPGETGELVGTALHSFAMPFLRYRLGDLVTRGAATCACGQPFSTLQVVQGRMVDYFSFADGRLLHPWELTTPVILNRATWIRQFQITQEREDRVLLRVAPARTPSPEELALVEASVRDRLGPRVTLRTELVAEVELETNGKYRAWRSLVRSAPDSSAPGRRPLEVSRAGVTVAVLMACHDRRETTLACLERLERQRLLEGVRLAVYLYDDGSRDGTSEAVRRRFPAVRLLPGDGLGYWNGGMRLAFQAALERGHDFYLWLNDDTGLKPEAISTLLTTAEHAGAEGRPVIAVGSTRDPIFGRTTYGGVRVASRWNRLRCRLVEPAADRPVACDTMYGNCVLIPRDAVARVGNLDPAFVHQMGDWDYGFRARAAGVMIVVCPGHLGTCPRRPGSGWRDRRLPLRQRWTHLTGPKGLPFRSWWVFCRRHAGPLWPLLVVSPYLKALWGAPTSPSTEGGT